MLWGKPFRTKLIDEIHNRHNKELKRLGLKNEKKNLRKFLRILNFSLFEVPTD